MTKRFIQGRVGREKCVEALKRMERGESSKAREEESSHELEEAHKLEDHHHSLSHECETPLTRIDHGKKENKENYPHTYYETLSMDHEGWYH